MNNCFGKRIKIEIFGESHSEVLGVKIFGLPEDFSISYEDMRADLEARKGGAIWGEKWATPRKEDDIPTISFSEEEGKPLIISFQNKNIRPSDYSAFTETPRPGHADFVSLHRFGKVFSGGGIFSGRMTLPLVAAGTVAKKLISPIVINSSVVEVGGVNCADYQVVETILNEALADGDSLGAIVECRCDNLPIGIGEPFFDSLESVISHLIFSIPGVRGIEFGDGFNAARMKGSEHNDAIISVDGKCAKNGAGGINGGISNGNPLYFRVAFKPTSSISKVQKSISLKSGTIEELSIKGRHDCCFALRTPIIVESACAIAIAELL